MVKKFYLDTSIWRDYFGDRGNGIRPLGEFAFQFLRKCKNERSIVIVSDIVVKELVTDLSEEQIKIMFSEFTEIIVRIEHTKEQAREAFILLKKFNRMFPFWDILHSIIARDKGTVLVTRDKHFKEIMLVEARTPEELL